MECEASEQPIEDVNFMNNRPRNFDSGTSQHQNQPIYPQNNFQQGKHQGYQSNYKSNYNVGQPRQQNYYNNQPQRYQPLQNQNQQEQGEVSLRELMNSISAQQQTIQQVQASVRNLEVQMGQMAREFASRQQ